MYWWQSFSIAVSCNCALHVSAESPDCTDLKRSCAASHSLSSPVLNPTRRPGGVRLHCICSLQCTMTIKMLLERALLVLRQLTRGELSDERCERVQPGAPAFDFNIILSSVSFSVLTTDP